MAAHRSQMPSPRIRTRTILLTQNVITRTVLLALILLQPVPISANPLNLPDMGASAEGLLSREQARRIGQAIMLQYRRQGELIEDLELANYIQNLGNRIGAMSNSEDSFTFFIVDDPSINAFAVPGGYIGIHSGLILAAKSEDEIAAVLAHEIAHVTQDHIVRGVERSQEASIPMTLAVAAAILLGVHDPNAAQAAIAATTAGGMQRRIDNIREFEREADRVGIQLLADSGYSPHSMADFFATLKSENQYAATAPEFLLTHPVNDERIADAQGRARQLDYQPLAQDSARLDAVQARLKVSNPNLLAFHKKYQGENRRSPYFQALIAGSNGDYASAIRQLTPLHESNPDSLAYTRSLAEMMEKAGRSDAAKAILNKGLQRHPFNALLTTEKAALLLKNGDPAEARQILLELIQLPRHVPAKVYQQLSDAELRLDNRAASHFYQAEYYYAIGELHPAIDQLQRAVREKSADFYLSSRIEARLKQLKTETATLQNIH